MVYFKIREGDPTKIKIGYTADRRGGTKRRKELQTGSPELLVDYIEPLWGHTKQTEKYFHAFLKKWHIRGDWLRLDKESGRIIRNIIDEIKRADLSMPLFAYAQRHDTQIFQLEEKLGAAVSKSQELEKQAWVALAEANKYRRLYRAARYKLDNPNLGGLAGFLIGAELGLRRPDGNTPIAKFDPHAKPVNLQELIERTFPRIQ